MSEQIYTFTDEELARMFKSGEMKLLVEPTENQEISGDLIKEWKRQAEKLAGLFAKKLGLSEEKYINSLPEFFPQPQSYKGRFDIPLIVQTPTEKLTLERMLEIAGIVNGLRLNDVKDWGKNPYNFITPNTPYTTWLHNGSRNLGRSVADVREGLAMDERGGTVLDSLALFIQNPDILNSHFLDCPGSQSDYNHSPCFDIFDEKPGLIDPTISEFGYDWGSVVAGREIKTQRF